MHKCGDVLPLKNGRIFYLNIISLQHSGWYTKNILSIILRRMIWYKFDLLECQPWTFILHIQKIKRHYFTSCFWSVKSKYDLRRHMTVKPIVKCDFNLLFAFCKSLPYFLRAIASISFPSWFLLFNDFVIWSFVFTDWLHYYFIEWHFLHTDFFMELWFFH